MTAKIQTSGSGRMRTKRHQVECTRHCACAWAVIVAAVCVGSMMVPPALAEDGKRVAFVVGIGAYDNLPPHEQLSNATNDADGVSEKLREIGFDVIPGR